MHSDCLLADSNLPAFAFGQLLDLFHQSPHTEFLLKKSPKIASNCQKSPTSITNTYQPTNIYNHHLKHARNHQNCQKLAKLAKKCRKKRQKMQKITKNRKKLPIVTGNTHQYHFQSICTTFAEFAMEKSVKINFALYLGNIHFSW